MPTLPMVGNEFAGYRLRSVIGRGGMSVVFQAENPRLGNVVALKVLAPELATNDVFRTRFLQESRTAAALNHPNVIPIFDVGPCEDLLYIAMRYVSGMDLRAELKKKRQISPEKTVRIMEQVARALDAAHRKGLVHRDVKPGNILLEEGMDDEIVHVYLADFGITKHALSRSGLTSTGEFLGTIDYVAPEQIQGTPVDGRTDQYSLGCVMYECLTGRVPFEKDLDAAVIWAHVEELPPMPSALKPELPGVVDEVFATVLAKKAADRYPSCREFVAAARGALAGYTAESPTVVPHQQPSASARASAPASPPPTRLDRPAGAGKRGEPAAPGGGGSGPARPRRRMTGRRWAAALGALAVVIAAGAGGWLATHGGTFGTSPSSGRSSAGGMGAKSPILGWLAAANAATKDPASLVTSATYPHGALPPQTCHAQIMTEATCSNPSLDVTRVIFQTYPSLTDLYKAYVEKVKFLNQGNFPENMGNCSSRLSQGEVSWNHQERHPRIYSVQRVASGTLDKDSQAAGRVFCNFPNSLNIVWTQNDRRLLGWLTATDHRVGFTWWANIHHNIPSPSGSSMHM